MTEGAREEPVFHPGDAVGSYRIIRALGRGGMGRVWEVEHFALKVRYALKSYSVAQADEDGAFERFVSEGRVLARMNHPNLVRVFDLGYDAKTGQMYFVMDLVTGADGEPRTLADFAPGEVDEQQVFVWFEELCRALAYVHAQGVVHRDVKLNNILVSRDGHAVLSDFGVSHIIDTDLRSDVDASKTIVSKDGSRYAMGTVGYMAPEVARGQDATPASDAYSLAVAIFRLLTNVWYDSHLAPGAAARSQGTDAVKLLEMFELNWKDVLPKMLRERPAERLVDFPALPVLVDPKSAKNGNSGFGGRSIAVAIVVGIVSLALGALLHMFWADWRDYQELKTEVVE